MITNAGKGVLRGRIEAVTALLAGNFYMAFSTDATVPSVTDVALTGEQAGNGLGRAVITAAHTTGQSVWTFQIVPTYTGSTALTINKIALFDAATAGNMVSVGIVSAAAFNTSGDTGTFFIQVSL
jgi:hypothetical protein